MADLPTIPGLYLSAPGELFRLDESGDWDDFPAPKGGESIRREWLETFAAPLQRVLLADEFAETLADATAAGVELAAAFLDRTSQGYVARQVRIHVGGKTPAELGAHS